uniref:Uncharacterized protein n=1 Tax=Cacopsylla melanoneura TaxID=428564 RepID=A0A8D8ZDJ3_9HEMI
MLTIPLVLSLSLLSAFSLFLSLSSFMQIMMCIVYSNIINVKFCLSFHLLSLFTFLSLPSLFSLSLPSLCVSPVSYSFFFILHPYYLFKYFYITLSHFYLFLTLV